MKLFYAVFLIPLFSGCIALKPDHISTIPNTPISIQWRESVGSNVRVAEILLPTANTIDMYDICIDKPYGTNFNGILWWRYSDTLCNNGSQILSIALSERWKSPVSFVFSKRKYTIPKYSYPRKRIEAVSRLSNSEIGVKVSSDGVKPYSVSINGKGKPFSLLRDTDTFYNFQILW